MSILEQTQEELDKGMQITINGVGLGSFISRTDEVTVKQLKAVEKSITSN